MTIRLGISTGPMRAGDNKMVMQNLYPPRSGLRSMTNKGPAVTSQHGNLPAVEVYRGPVQPGCPRGDDEGHEVGHVLDRAEAGESGLAPELLADGCFRLPGARDLGANAVPLPLGLDQARMGGIYLHALLLADVGEALGEGGDGGIDRAAGGG